MTRYMFVHLYQMAHKAVRRRRGWAFEYPCAHECGRDATDWAYDHSDPNAVRCEFGIFSEDVWHYKPLCKSCHLRFDIAERKQRTAAP